MKTAIRLLACLFTLALVGLRLSADTRTSFGPYHTRHPLDRPIGQPSPSGYEWGDLNSGWLAGIGGVVPGAPGEARLTVKLILQNHGEAIRFFRSNGAAPPQSPFDILIVSPSGVADFIGHSSDHEVRRENNGERWGVDAKSEVVVTVTDRLPRWKFAEGDYLVYGLARIPRLPAHDAREYMVGNIKLSYPSFAGQEAAEVRTGNVVVRVSREQAESWNRVIATLPPNPFEEIRRKHAASLTAQQPSIKSYKRSEAGQSSVTADAKGNPTGKANLKLTDATGHVGGSGRVSPASLAILSFLAVAAAAILWRALRRA